MTFIRLFMGPMVARFGAVPLLFGGVFTCAIAARLVPIFPVPAYKDVESPRLSRAKKPGYHADGHQDGVRVTLEARTQPKRSQSLGERHEYPANLILHADLQTRP